MRNIDPDSEQNQRETRANNAEIKHLQREASIVRLDTLCTLCKKPITCEWPLTMEWGGETVTAQEYLARALRSEKVFICCDSCLEVMPDVDLGTVIGERIDQAAPARGEGT